MGWGTFTRINQHAYTIWLVYRTEAHKGQRIMSIWYCERPLLSSKFRYTKYQSKQWNISGTWVNVDIVL